MYVSTMQTVDAVGIGQVCSWEMGPRTWAGACFFSFFLPSTPLPSTLLQPPLHPTPEHSMAHLCEHGLAGVGWNVFFYR